MCPIQTIDPFNNIIASMPGKGTAGFTKEGQNAKFIRHRDIKLKDKEVRREAHIQKAMIEGICQKCRLIVQWRFRYDKYKPLKNRGTCNDCKQKTVLKAYRSLCDECGKRRRVCCSCCGEITTENENMVIDTDGNVSERASAKGSKPTKAVTPAAVEVSATASADNDDVTMSVSADEISELPEICVTGASVAAAATEWDARSFSNFAASKYDKNRKVGSEVDTVFVFGEAIAAPTSVEPDMEEA